MKWILIVIWHAGVNTNTSAVSMQEFNTSEACQWAGQQITERKTNISAPTMVCVPKGKE